MYYSIPRFMFWLMLTFICVVFWAGVGVSTMPHLYIDIAALGSAVIAILICVGYLDKDAIEYRRLQGVERKYKELVERLDSDGYW